MSGFLIAVVIILVILVCVIAVNSEVDKEIMRYNASEVLNALKNENYYIIDIRPKSQYETGYIESVTNLPASAIMKNYKELPKDKQIVLICNSGMTSFRLLCFLKDQGFDNISDLKGGIRAWEKAGYDIKK